MINLDKLNSQFDIKNIEVSQIAKLLLEHQKYVKLALLVGALLIVGGLYNDHRLKEAGLRARMSQEQAKLDVIKTRDAAIVDLNHFKASLPKELNVFDVVTLISNYAKSYNVTVSSYTPSQGKDMGLYDVIDVRFDVVADNFKDMVLFLRRIEKSDSPIRINSWVGNETSDGKITFTIDISAVRFHP